MWNISNKINAVFLMLMLQLCLVNQNCPCAAAEDNSALSQSKPTEEQKNSAVTAAMPPNSSAAPHRPLRCPAPANPYKRSQECWNEPVDFDKAAMFGNWSGARSALKEIGLTPTASYTTEIMANSSGASHSKIQYTGLVFASLTFDYEKLLKIPGLSMIVSGTWGTGGNLSSRLGTLFNVMSADEGAGVWLVHMYLQETLLDGALTIAAGRMGQADVFASLPIFGNYVNGGFNGNPGSLLINHPSFAEPPPGTQWGVQATYNQSPHWQISLGVYNTNANSAAGADNGVDFTLQEGNKGAMYAAQLSYMRNQGSGDKGMQGIYTIGGLYDETRYSGLSGVGSRTGNWDVYAMFQQMVYREGDESSQGLTLWGQITYSGRDEVNLMPFLVGAGMSYQGIICGRDDDIATVGWLYGKISKFVPSSKAEQVYEANYQITLNNWFNILPDFQYVRHPGGLTGTSAVRDAVVMGIQVSMTL